MDLRPALRRTVARITLAPNDAGTPCPSAADRDSNQHRSGATWIARTVQEILGNPVYIGRMVWNRQRTDRVLIDPDNPALGHREVSRRNNPEDWIISEQPVHPALVPEADFVAVRGLRGTKRRMPYISAHCAAAAHAMQPSL